mgnify:CR=1 FL=1
MYNGDHKIIHHNIIPQLTCAFGANSLDQPQLEGTHSTNSSLLIIDPSSSSWAIQPADMALSYIVVVGRLQDIQKRRRELSFNCWLIASPCAPWNHGSCCSHCLTICQHFDIVATTAPLLMMNSCIFQL